MSDNAEYEELLQKEEKKHKKILKYDMEIGITLVVIVIIISVANLSLKSNYQAIKEARAGIAPLMIECNKDILNAAETFRKNSTDSAAIVQIDKAKLAYDGAILYYGKTMKKGMDEGLIVAVLDTCFRAANTFRTTLESQPELLRTGVTVPMLNAMDKNILQIRTKIDSLIAGIESYNAGSFFLFLNSVTPYPGKIEYQRLNLPDVTPYTEPPPAEKPAGKK
jgi:hypothetical protein